MIGSCYRARQVEVVRMATQAPAQGPVIRDVTEYEARSLPGVPVLIAGIIAILAVIALFYFDARVPSGAARDALIWVGVIVIVVDAFALRGLTPVIAGEGRAIQLFGSYRGTVRTPGLHCVNPFSVRRAVSVRVRNLETQQAKVNDAD